MKTHFITVWKLIPHHLDRATALNWAKKNRRLAIGWGFTGDLKNAKYAQPKDIAEAIKTAYLDGTHPYKNYGEGSLSLWSMVHEMKKDDLVIIVGNGGRREFVARVTSEYQYNEHLSVALGNYFHHREIEITELDPNQIWELAGGKIEAQRSPYATLARCEKRIDLLA